MAGSGVVEQLQLGDHVCALVDGTDDRLRVMAQAVAAGLDSGHMVVVLTEALPPVAVQAALEQRGVSFEATRRPGQVQILPARPAHLSTGRFEPSRMLDCLAGHVERAVAGGFPGLRLVGDMAWALGELVDAEGLADYEAQVNRLYLDGRAMGVCLYDRRVFDADLLRQVTRAHPAAVTDAVTEAASGWTPLLRIRRTTDRYGLRLVGESDLSNRRAVAAALDAVLVAQPDPGVPIVVDVAGLRFADGATAALLGRLALRGPAGVHIVGCHGALQTVLDRLGVTQLPGICITRVARPAGGATGRPGPNGVEMVR